MTSQIPARWIAAARWSSGFDVRPVLSLLGRQGFEQAPESILLAHGVPPRLVASLPDTCPQPFDGVWWTVDDDRYPASLLELSSPPALVCLRGRLDLLDRPGITVVGSRACTSYGRGVARDLGRAVAQAGGVLVSGAARGVDTSAHEGALDAGGTIAVLGAGLDHAPSYGARKLHARLAREGLLRRSLPL